MLLLFDGVLDMFHVEQYWAAIWVFFLLWWVCYRCMAMGLICFGGALGCAKQGKPIITPNKNTFRVKRGKPMLWGYG